TLRIGRQTLDSQGNRLISTREAANLRLAFDMISGTSHVGPVNVMAFYGRPVLNRRGSFDDHHNDAEKFTGGWARWSAGDAGPDVSVFYLSRDRAVATYQEGRSSDERRTLGARASGRSAQWDYAFQASRQYGHFGAKSIESYGIAGDLGWRAWTRFS